ncbi:hypothetical protein Dsin_022961 [Dipteronia sinensis]|uniref:Xylanase inhibitor C-terminal domain-containing protein n=1 Tax=Dipteronia sinensis TaxID=43782 RepID=A0AAE0A3V5_9ROSI|nr:hypothetical protein Dsin_022961 [Dipteronia sinensis]
MGLDLSRYSLNAQLQGLLGTRFSYCVIPFYINDPTVSLLRFENDIPQPNPTIQVQEINYFFKPGLSYYVLKLIGISVGPTRLQFREDAITPHDQGGAAFVDMYMDTGNPYGGIGRTAGGVDVYEPVIRAFKDYHAARHILHERPESRDVEFQLCYYYPPEGFNDYPTLTYHFEGADYVVDGKNVLVDFPDPEQRFFCVGLKKAEGWSVLGALLMQDKRIIIDGINSKIQFYPEQCIYDIYK